MYPAVISKRSIGSFRSHNILRPKRLTTKPSMPGPRRSAVTIYQMMRSRLDGCSKCLFPQGSITVANTTQKDLKSVRIASISEASPLHDLTLLLRPETLASGPSSQETATYVFDISSLPLGLRPVPAEAVFFLTALVVPTGRGYITSQTTAIVDMSSTITKVI